MDCDFRDPFGLSIITLHSSLIAHHSPFSTCFDLTVAHIILSPTSDGVSITRHQKIIIPLA